MSDEIKDVLSERGKTYGDFTNIATTAYEIRLALFRGCPILDADMREALTMIAAKLSRVVNGDPTYIDTWLDIEGYARLVRERLERENND